MAKIFVSYRDEDCDYRNSFVGIFVQHSNIIDIPIIDRENYRKTSEKQIKGYIRSLMKKCSALVLLLGKNTHNGTWVLHEISIALSRRIPIFAVRIPNTRGGLPLILKKKKINIVEWNPLQIKNEIDSLFGRN